MKSFAKRALFQALRVALVAVTVSLAVQTYLDGWKKPQPVVIESRLETNEPSPSEPPTTESSPPQTLWDALQNDPSLTKFTKLVGEFEDIVGGLRAPRAQLTIYAPVNEAFDKEDFPYDLPWFYWKFLVGYHMGKGSVSAQALPNQNTVSSFVNADIFFKNQQRISVQDNHPDNVTFNFCSKLLSSKPAVNGHLHVVDRLLMLPDSAADVLRYTPSLGIFRQGLIQTGLAEVVNDTSTHIGQTLFVPSNAAFNQLGRKVNSFLFGPGGSEYLKALLAYHIVANETLFSDVHFPAKNGEQFIFSRESTTNSVEMPTLAGGHFVSASSILQSGGRRTISVNDEWKVSRPDIVVMDGVIHELDAVLLPPLMEGEGQLGKEKLNWWSIVKRSMNLGGGITVEELMERLQPLIESEGSS
ncbi:Fasciclin domain family protein [Penicillium brasilianum]|uniref:Fasciclin domain family protein n=1 Tax=Penicillium brasilianum TaxID=104259 RepID=A0A1S9RPN5_PENBI|nr:Fasciclin domain family protein [Penicillium brasilianum]